MIIAAMLEEATIGVGHMRIFLHYLDMAPSETSNASSAENYDFDRDVNEWIASAKRLFTEQSTSSANTRTIFTQSTTAPIPTTSVGVSALRTYDNVSESTSDTNIRLNDGCIPSFISKVTNGVLYTAKSETIKEDIVVRLEVYPMTAILNKERKVWWKEATYRSCVQVPADANAVKELQQRRSAPPILQAVRHIADNPHIFFATIRRQRLCVYGQALLSYEERDACVANRDKLMDTARL
ncbi:hypothetical protein U1Q18_051090 [Sarracenia purpurea var. burkii]